MHAIACLMYKPLISYAVANFQSAHKTLLNVTNVAGLAVLPSDFASHSAPLCNNPKCKICTFVQPTDNSVVRHVSTQDIIDGTIKHCFASITAWISIQSECIDLDSAHYDKEIEHNKSQIKRYISVLRT